MKTNLSNSILVLFFLIMLVISITPVFADVADFTSGTDGTINIDQVFGATTFGVDVTVLSRHDLVFSSLIIDKLDIRDSTSQVKVRIYRVINPNLDSLIASGEITVFVGNDQSITIPVSQRKELSLMPGETYRIVVFIQSTTDSRLDVFDPNPTGQERFPYIESNGLLQINGSYIEFSDVFPDIATQFMPIISLEYVEKYYYRISSATGICMWNTEECETNLDHPDPRCWHGHRIHSLAFPTSYEYTYMICCTAPSASECSSIGGILETQGCIAWPSGILDPYCAHFGDICTESPSPPYYHCASTGECMPYIAPGTVVELPNGIDDDCDGYIDDEACDGIDNDGNGMIDDSPGSCLRRIVYIPLAWTGTQADFVSAAQSQWYQFARDLVEGCPDNFSHTFLDISEDNVWPAGCGGDINTELRNYIESKYGSRFLIDSDVFIGITNQDICDKQAGVNSGNVMWIENSIAVLAHEFGHSLGLEDEYCSNRAGSTDERCNDGGIRADYNGDGILPDPDVNILRADLGCDPEPGDCCSESCADENYDVCCQGNMNYMLGRCIMSYANADGPRRYCQSGIDHIKGPSVGIDCLFKHQGHGPVFSMMYGVTEDGQISILSSPIIGLGRQGLKVNSSDGRYAIEIKDYNGSLLHRSAQDLSFTYEGPMFLGVDYSDITYDQRVLDLRAPIDSVTDNRLKIIAYKDGVITSQTCLSGNNTLPTGIITLETDTIPPTIQCPSEGTFQCSEIGGTPADNDDLTSFLYYPYNHTLDNCDGNPSVTSDAPSFFVLGITDITFTATDSDGNSSSCSSAVNIVDTIAPAVSCPSDITIECAFAGGTQANDPQLTSFFNAFTTEDACDANPFRVNDAPSFFNLGATVVTFTAVDGSGNSSSCKSTVTVVDTTPPDISIEITQDSLWPPNHEMVHVLPIITVSDICDTTPEVSLISITMNEDDNFTGDGNTTDDIEINNGDIYLRAERSGTGSGRTYTITYSATDSSGNVNMADGTVIVRHNK